MDPRAYADALEGYLSEPKAVSASPRVMVLPSEPLSSVHLHQAIEDAGALVVAEDDWWGAARLALTSRLPARPKESIFHKYWLDTASSGGAAGRGPRSLVAAQQACPDVDCVVFYLPPSDHQLGWDYPRLRDGSPSAASGACSASGRGDIGSRGGHVRSRSGFASAEVESSTTTRGVPPRHEELTQLQVTHSLARLPARVVRQAAQGRVRAAGRTPSAARLCRTRSSRRSTCRSSPTSGTRAWSPRVGIRPTTRTFSQSGLPRGPEPVRRAGAGGAARRGQPGQAVGRLSKPALVVTGAGDRGADVLARVSARSACRSRSRAQPTAPQLVGDVALAVGRPRRHRPHRRHGRAAPRPDPAASRSPASAWTTTACARSSIA